jgi:dTDP-4-dehydrorhamnose reductase
VINCAAYNAVDGAESNEEGARRINAVAVGLLAGLCAGIDGRFVTFSTDYVFDGTKTAGYVESDPPSPLSVYGRSKLEGENLALSNNPRSLVIRTSWLLSATHPNFVSQILTGLDQGSVRVVDDQIGCPTNVDDLALGTMRAPQLNATGLLHLAGGEAMTRFDLARASAVLAGRSVANIEATISAELPGVAAGPSNSILLSKRLIELGLEPLPPVTKSLPLVVSALVDASDGESQRWG